MVKSKDNQNKEINNKKLQCQGECKKIKAKNGNNFYKSNNPIHQNDYYKGYAPFCKQCLREKIFEKDGKTVKINSLLEVLELLDKPYIQEEYIKVLNKGKGIFDLGEYSKDVTFCYPKFRYKNSDGVNKDGFKEQNNNSDISQQINSKNFVFTDEDKQVKNDIIKLMGYDPFFNYSKIDQKFLYNELLPYLDEDTIEDGFKLSQIIQIVDNNNQIRNINEQKNKLIFDGVLENESKIKTLTAITKSISDTTNAIAKENSISVKNRADKKSGKSELTALMKKYREDGFEDAEQDYYDQNKAIGMKMVANISNGSILEQLQLDENDTNEMLFSQKELIEKLQKKVADLEEENRQLYVKLGEK